MKVTLLCRKKDLFGFNEHKVGHHISYTEFVKLMEAAFQGPHAHDRGDILVKIQ